MDNLSPDNRGTIVRMGNISRINNALVEEVSTNSDRLGYIVVSYAVRGRNNMTKIELLRLNIGRNTIIINQSGGSICLCDITKGMWINAVFSSRVASSIPPQAQAFKITARQRTGNPEPPAGVTTTGRILKVDTSNNFLITGNPRNMSQQMRFNVSNETIILNRNGRRVSLNSLMPSQMVEITHADFQTASIPPQSPAFSIQIL